jgi:hypothetical protein
MKRSFVFGGLFIALGGQAVLASPSNKSLSFEAVNKPILDPIVRPIPAPALSPISLDLSKAVLAGNTVEGASRKSLLGQFIRLGREDRLAAVFPDFGVNLDSSELALTARSSLVVAVPYKQQISGFLPKSVRFLSAVKIYKDAGVRLTISGSVSLAGSAARPSVERYSTHQKIDGLEYLEYSWDLSNLSSRERSYLCSGSGVLRANITFGAERESGYGDELRIEPAAGESLVAVVEAEGMEPCDLD